MALAVRRREPGGTRSPPVSQPQQPAASAFAAPAAAAASAVAGTETLASQQPQLRPASSSILGAAVAGAAADDYVARLEAFYGPGAGSSAAAAPQEPLTASLQQQLGGATAALPASSTAALPTSSTELDIALAAAPGGNREEVLRALMLKRALGSTGGLDLTTYLLLQNLGRGSNQGGVQSTNDDMLLQLLQQQQPASACAASAYESWAAAASAGPAGSSLPVTGTETCAAHQPQLRSASPSLLGATAGAAAEAAYAARKAARASAGDAGSSAAAQAPQTFDSDAFKQRFKKGLAERAGGALMLQGSLGSGGLVLSEEPEAYFRVGPQVDLLQRPEAGAAVAKQDARSRLMMRRRHHQEPNARQPQHLPQHSLEQLLDEGHAAAVAAVAAAAGDPAANHQAAPSVRSVRCSGVFRQRDGWEAQLCLDNKCHGDVKMLSLGTFSSEADAVCAWTAAARHFGGFDALLLNTMLSQPFALEPGVLLVTSPDAAAAVKAAADAAGVPQPKVVIWHRAGGAHTSPSAAATAAAAAGPSSLPGGMSGAPAAGASTAAGWKAFSLDAVLASSADLGLPSAMQQQQQPPLTASLQQQLGGATAALPASSTAALPTSSTELDIALAAAPGGNREEVLRALMLKRALGSGGGLDLPPYLLLQNLGRGSNQGGVQSTNDDMLLQLLQQQRQQHQQVQPSHLLAASPSPVAAGARAGSFAAGARAPSPSPLLLSPDTPYLDYDNRGGAPPCLSPDDGGSFMFRQQHGAMAAAVRELDAAASPGPDAASAQQQQQSGARTKADVGGGAGASSPAAGGGGAAAPGARAAAAAARGAGGGGGGTAAQQPHQEVCWSSVWQQLSYYLKKDERSLQELVGAAAPAAAKKQSTSAAPPDAAANEDSSSWVPPDRASLSEADREALDQLLSLLRQHRSQAAETQPVDFWQGALYRVLCHLGDTETAQKLAAKTAAAAAARQEGGSSTAAAAATSGTKRTWEQLWSPDAVFIDALPPGEREAFDTISSAVKMFELSKIKIRELQLLAVPTAQHHHQLRVNPRVLRVTTEEAAAAIRAAAAAAGLPPPTVYVLPEMGLDLQGEELLDQQASYSHSSSSGGEAAAGASSTCASEAGS